jgi:disulfide oxidoreductase YuzD
VTFSSKQGRNFEVRVKQDGYFGPVVLMEREEAIETGKYLRKTEQMCSFADKRIRP